MTSIDYTINEALLYRAIETATELKNDKDVFEGLTQIAKTKSELKDLLETVEKIETESKGLINSRAKALYGNDWQVIAGEHFKVTRSKTGEIYTINGEPNKKFIKVKKSVDSKAVEDFVADNDKLPAGIEINDKRGESLRITVK
jgi:hypothetical protein